MQSETDKAKLSRRKVRLFLGLLIFLFSFGIRLIGIQWGFPNEQRHQSLHPDELVIKEFADRTPYFKPGFYNYGTLYLTVLKIASDMGRTYGYVPEGKDVPQWKTDRAIHLTGRMISALSASAATLFVFLILVIITGEFGALFGSALLVAAPGFLVHSRFQTSDVFATALIALAAYLLLLFMQHPERIRWLYGASAIAGLSAGTKYAAVLLLIPLILVAFSFRRSEFIKVSAFSIGWFILALLIATPGIVLETKLFWNGLSYEMRHTSEGHGIVFADTPSGFIYHIGNLIDSLGLVPFFLGVAGLIFAVVRKQQWIIATLLFCIVYYVLIGRAEVKFVRYVFPLVPFFIVGAGYLVGELFKGAQWQKGVSLLLLFSAVFGMRAQIGPVTLTQLMSQNDPRDTAAIWLKEKHPNKTVGFVTDPWFYSPPLFPNTGLLGANNRLHAMQQESSNLLRYTRPDGNRMDWDPELLIRMKPDIIVFSSFEFIDNDRINQPDFLAFLDILFRDYQMIALFWGPNPRIAEPNTKHTDVNRIILRNIFWGNFPIRHDLMYIQPTICIFQKNPSALNPK